MSKLHLVFGGRVSDPQGLDFTELDRIDLVGIYPSHAEAVEAWRGRAQRTVDDAEMKYVVVHLHRLLEPDVDAEPADGVDPDGTDLSPSSRRRPGPQEGQART